METIFKRRSVRKYTETPVTDVQVKQIILRVWRHRVQKQSGVGVYRFAGPGDL